ncbi:DUF4241 domain-containing protein [Flammeovirga aprica]|uniref:DUF4241 domain-containing protein n=1 Tax=Flammeovirga aprica JL-4 TaxID=694437 RepID=A0A7X9RUD5_9BACT|nr:DUF4241 domain-containing protein [Flammeovirga aprica]NME68881.1 DUF4241 domain-containing protein [Flammeovirga aprica JL-4]
MDKRIAASPEARVKLFTEHWYKQWKTISDNHQKNDKKDFDFEVWREMVNEVDKSHFLENCGSETQGSFTHSQPRIHKDFTEILDVKIKEGEADVITKTEYETRYSDSFLFFKLKLIDNNWLIQSIDVHANHPHTLMVSDQHQQEIFSKCSESAPFLKVIDQLDLNENILFQHGRKVETKRFGEGVTEINTVGNLNLQTGVMSILDIGYDFKDFEPLHIKVKPGQYKVESLTAFGKSIGVRVLFSDEKAVKWYAANTLNGYGIYTVDAGNLAIFDAGDLTKLTFAQKEYEFNKWSRVGGTQLITLENKNDCVITDGDGDGSYPALWGVNENEEIVSLCIDFIILVEENENEVLYSV